MSRRSNSVTSAVTRFAVAGLVAVGLLALLTLVVVSRISTAEALKSARERARLAGVGVIEPALVAAIVDPNTDPEAARSALASLDELVQTRVLSETVVRVKIWSESGKVIYSDEPRLIGQQFRAKSDHAEAIRTGATGAERADTTGPENRFERDAGRLLEVYLPLRAADGTPLVYEQYERYDSVVGNSRELLRRLGFALGAGLALLWLTQLPLARSMARRVRAAEAEHAELSEQAITASERERERIAADLHDGVVQDLAGLTFELSAASASTPAGPQREMLERSAAIARTSMQRLRSSLVDLHPPTVHSLGLVDGMESLAGSLREHGTAVAIQLDLPDLDAESESLLYRVTQELLRNVEEHANATSVVVIGRAADDAVSVTVHDNGRGFGAEERSQRASEGHLGLDLQDSLVKRAGGRLTVSSEPGRGTTATVELPR